MKRAILKPVPYDLQHWLCYGSVILEQCMSKVSQQYNVNRKCTRRDLWDGDICDYAAI